MPDPYLLVRTGNESQRLNDQHLFWKRQCGYLIHPQIAASLPQDARIADLAAGTGVWAADTTQAHSGVHVDAFDISSEQFPSEKARPNRVHFHVHNVLEPFPESMTGQYHLVHIRALVAAMKPSDWEVATHNIKTLLKPGGAIQWTETHMNGLAVLRSQEASDRPTAPVLSGLLQGFTTALRLRDLDGPLRLPGIFNDAGLKNIIVDTISTDRVVTDRPKTTENFVTAMLGWAQSLSNDLQSQVEIARAIESEIAAGAYLRCDISISIGRQP